MSDGRLPDFEATDESDEATEDNDLEIEDAATDAAEEALAADELFVSQCQLEWGRWTHTALTEATEAADVALAPL